MSSHLITDTNNDDFNTTDMIIYSIVGGVLLCLLILICWYLVHRARKVMQIISSSTTTKDKHVVQSVSKPTAMSIDLDTKDQLGGKKIDHKNIDRKAKGDNHVIDGMNVTSENNVYVENQNGNGDQDQDEERSVHDSYYERTHHLFHSSSSNDFDLEFGGQTFEI